MNNKLTMTWGCIPGRQVGSIPKGFHKRRGAHPDSIRAAYERGVAKERGCTLKEARKIVTHWLASRKVSTPADHALIEAGRLERKATRDVADYSESIARRARVAAYLEEQA